MTFGVRIATVAAKLKLLPRFTCGDCGYSELGSARTVELSAPDPTLLAGAVAQLAGWATYMPTGWASYSTGFRCSQCQQKREHGRSHV